MTISEKRVPSIAGITGDKDRVNALYAPFRPRDANPEHYDRKLKFWLKAVDEYCDHCRRVSFTVKELQDEFRVDGRAPACLPDVVSQVCRDGTVVPEKSFYENLKSSESWTAWSQVSAWKAIRKIGSFVPVPMGYFSRSDDEELRYINMERLKTLMESIQSEPSLISKLMNIETWKTKVSDITKIREPADIEYLLRYLNSKKCLVVDRVGSEEVIMMSPVGSYPKITDVEKGKYDIARTKELLEKQLQDLTERKVLAEEKARATLKQGLRSTAKHELRRKKLLEQRMDKLLSMIDNLSVLESQIEDAESDAALISAYEVGKKALSGVLSDKRLNTDHVTETMLDIQDLLEQQADINAALSQPMDNQDPDLADLESELDALMKEDEQKHATLQPTPASGSTPKKNEDDEILKQLEALDLDGLDNLDIPTPSPTSKMDKSGDA